MKTRKTMPVSSSDRRDALAVSVPTAWHELTEAQLLYAIGLLAMGVPAERAQVYAFCVSRGWAS